jgi:hypothetical protein
MISSTPLKSALNILIATVWLVNGLFCKVLNLVPRHRAIVAEILGEDYATLITKTIGTLEIVMVLWIFSKIKPRFCAITQMVIVATMNILEFAIVPNLLLFGKLNIFFAFCFIIVIGCNEFFIHKLPVKSLNSK